MGRALARPLEVTQESHTSKRYMADPGEGWATGEIVPFPNNHRVAVVALRLRPRPQFQAPLGRCC